MPSSKCWPLGLISHFCGESSPRSLNTSSWLDRENSPRRFTHGPKLVDTVTSGEAVTMRSASGPPARAISSSTRPKPACVDAWPFTSILGNGSTGTRAACSRRVPFAMNGTSARNASTSRLKLEAGEPVPFLPLIDALAGAQLVHLRLGHQAGMVVLVALEGQAVALDGVGDEALGLVGRRALEGLQDRLQVVAAEVGHEAGERGIVVPAHDGERIGMDGEVVLELPPPGRAALEHQRRVEHVGAVVDPLLEALAAGLGEGALQQLAVLEKHDLPAEVLEQARHLHEQAVGNDRVRGSGGCSRSIHQQFSRPCFQYSSSASCTLPSSISASPMIADHAALGPVGAPALGVHIVLHQAGKAGLGDAEADGARGEIDVG